MTALLLDKAVSTPDSTETLTGYLREADKLLAREGFDVIISRDMSRWVEILETAPGSDGVNPTFDPARTGPHDDAFWVGATKDNRIAAVFAMRLFHVEHGWYDLVRRGLLWSSPPGRPTPILIDEAGPTGAIGHSGGHWVHPDYRGIGLSWILPRYGQAWAQIIWSLGYITSVMMADVRKAGIGRNYGVERTRLLIDGWFWPRQTHKVVYAGEYSADHLVARAARDRSLIVNESDKKLRDFAPIARKRHDEPAIGDVKAVHHVVNE